ncbi:translocation protein Sec62-domain-containing protein [Chaetomium sp. MPI-CAGE-AT-0009]|nr:translocation protein Sec62-domain-containing protein [Chaetomium sp. MPI-CAGE-AT-0009]
MQAPPPQGPPQGGQMPMMPSPEQIAHMQRQLAIDAEKMGMTVPQFIEHLKRQAQERMQAQQQQQQQQGQEGHDHQHQHQHQHPHPHQHQHQHPPQGQQQPIVPGPPNPVAIALAKFLRSQTLKPRTCILNGERKDMFRVKRALRALESDAYKAARKKNPALPEITDRASLENAFKLLPLSMLALRVVKSDPHEGHDHGPSGKKQGKRTKGLWTVRIEPQQEAGDDMYYVWLWEGSQVMRKVYAALALAAIFAVVCYPLWPVKLRQGGYYLSWAFLCFMGLFFAMAIFRVILFCITYFILPPGFWLFPNLWEDVSVVDSFKPVWAWHEPAAAKKKKKSKKSASGSAAAGATFSGATGQPAPASATTTATATQISTGPQQRSYMAPRVEELPDDE